MRFHRLWAPSGAGRQPRRLFRVVLAMLLLQSLIPLPALAEEWVDQHQDAITGAYAVVPGFELAQTVTSGADGRLTRVALHVANLLDPAELTVELQSLTSAGAPSGTVLATSGLNLPEPSPSRWVELSFANPPAVSRGDRYAIVVKANATLSWSNASYAPYTAGEAWLWTGDWATARHDYTFRAYLQTGNTPPSGTADTYDLQEDMALQVAAPGVLENDRDPDGDVLAAAVATHPVHGTLDLRADGSFTYKPDPGFRGLDQFAYTVSDATYTSEPITVALSVAPSYDSPVPQPPVGDQKWTGGGWIAQPRTDGSTEKAHFAFKLVTGENGAVEGRLKYRFTDPDGRRYQVRVTRWHAEVASYDSETGKTSFSGRAEIQQVPGETERVPVLFDGLTVRIDLVDGQSATFAITITDGSGEIWHQAGGPIKGGVIKHRVEDDE